MIVIEGYGALLQYMLRTTKDIGWEGTVPFDSNFIGHGLSTFRSKSNIFEIIMIIIYSISRYLPNHQLRWSHSPDDQEAITPLIISSTKGQIVTRPSIRKETTTIIDSSNN